MKIEHHIFHSVRHLELYAKRIVEGFLSGPNKSQRSGVGMEFKQYRNYQPGDDIRLLDWKMYARSGKYFIKESEIDTDVTIRLILDSSASMLYQEGSYSKFEYGKLLLAVLSLIALNQGDQVKVEYINSSSQLKELQRLRSIKDFQNLLVNLDSIDAQALWPRLSDIMPQIQNKRKQLTILISDLYEINDEIERVAKALNTVSSEMMVFHLVFRKEEKMEFSGNIVFEDLESGQRIEANASSIKSGYLQSREEDLERIKSFLLGNEIYYHKFYAENPVEVALSSFLHHREKLR